MTDTKNTVSDERLVEMLRGLEGLDGGLSYQLPGDLRSIITELQSLRASQAQSALAAMRAERDRWEQRFFKMDGNFDRAVARAEAAEAQALRLTEENEALRKELHDWQNGHSKSVRAHAEALGRIKALEEALTRIAAIKYGKPDTLYAQKTVIDYARDQASTALKENEL